MSTRDRTILIAVITLVLVGAGWLMVIQPRRQQASKLGSQLSSAQAQLNTLRTQVAQDEAAKSAFQTNYASLARLGEAVPADDDVPSLVYQLQSAASASSVDFRGLQLAPGAGGSAPAPASSPTAGQSATATLPPGATVGPAGLPIEPFTFTFTGNFFHLAAFFQRLQKFVVANNQHVWVSGRLMTLNTINLGAGPNGFPQIQASIAATTYLVPASQGLLNGATAAGPAAPSATSVSTTPTTSGPAAPAAAVTPPVR